MKITDTERLDFLQKLTDESKYTGRVILRESTTGRGWRLHETSQEYSTPSVRGAIDYFMLENDVMNVDTEGMR